MDLARNAMTYSVLGFAKAAMSRLTSFYSEVALLRTSSAEKSNVFIDTQRGLVAIRLLELKTDV